MIALIITNIILVVVIGIAGIALLVEAVKNSRPIVIKEAKALREYYERKLKDTEKRADKAEQNYTEYKGLYNRELQRSSDRNDILSEKDRLVAQVERLNNEISSCDDRINDMAQENASLKEQIKALKESATKKPAKKGRESKNAKG